MGSFYTKCSITEKTITDGMPTTVQFMLPSRFSHGESISAGKIFVESFLKVAKSKGIDEALKSFEESTKTWGNELKNKGMIVSNNIDTSEFVPFGPAIKGFYNDCGDIRLDDSEENLKRVKLLEAMCGVQFETILEASTDDRWYTLGFMDGSKGGSHDWNLKGIDKDLPELFLTLLKKLSVTYMHTAAYETMVADLLPNGYCKDEYTDGVEKNLKLWIKQVNAQMGKSKKTKGKVDYHMIGLIRDMNEDLSSLLWVGMYKTNSEDDISWYMETTNFLYALSMLEIPLRRSYYGSQENNWGVCKKIHEAVDSAIKLEEIKRNEE